MGLTAANPLHAAAAVDIWDRQMQNSFIDPAPNYYASSVNIHQPHESAAATNMGQTYSFRMHRAHHIHQNTWDWLHHNQSWCLSRSPARGRRSWLSWASCTSCPLRRRWRRPPLDNCRPASCSVTTSTGRRADTTDDEAWLESTASDEFADWTLGWGLLLEAGTDSADDVTAALPAAAAAAVPSPSLRSDCFFRQTRPATPYSSIHHASDKLKFYIPLNTK